ncbi:ribonuclease D [Luteolibacter marinus]|uniref:ribonuclease D n=1 Tax=Luteolibacter marinus TaxID=2776705 RepID=UPI001868C1AC|nr:ribonuclease D [Luteolibacter marinus]
MSSPVLVRSHQELTSLLSRPQAGAVCAIDTEADSLHRYRESLCLVQYACEEENVLIDPLEIEDLSPLGEFLSGRPVWMHGADYDMTMLRRSFGTLPPAVFDTQIGARLLGVRKFGLANLVELYFGVVLSKSSQKADWGKRPLSPKMMDYALNDVRYLLPMGEEICRQLKEKGRYEWFVESCDAARAKVLERDDTKEDPWRIQGSGRLDRAGLNFLKHLWEWRDSEAASWDRPSFMVVTNRQLIEWSMALTQGRRIDIPSHYRPDRRKRLTEALDAARALDSGAWPEKPRGLRRRRDSDFDARVAKLISQRDKKGEELDIDSSLIAPRSVLEAIAEGEASPDEVLLGWQRQCMSMD